MTGFPVQDTEPFRGESSATRMMEPMSGRGREGGGGREGESEGEGGRERVREREGGSE